MKIMNRPRAGGKTYALLNALLFTPNAVLVVATHMHKRHAVNAALHNFPQTDRDYWEARILVYDTMEKLRGQYPILAAHTTVYVDNVEQVLAVALGQEPHIVTTTSEQI